MRKELRDGLFMDNSIYITDEKKPGFPIQVRIIQFFAIMIGSWGSIGLLLESIAIPADYFKVNMAILLCAGLMFTLCLIPSLDLVKLFFGFLFYTLYFLSRIHAIQNAFYILENKVIEQLVDYYGMEPMQYIANYKTATQDSTLLMIMIVIPLVALFTVAILRNRFVGIAGILLFLPAAISFLFGLIPAERYLLAYAAAVIYLSRASYSCNNVTAMEQKLLLHRINSRAAVWLCLISLLLFSVLKLFITEEKYSSVSELKETKKEIQTALFNLSVDDFTDYFKDIHLFNYEASVGGLSGGDLGNVGEVTFEDTEQLLITAPLGSIKEGVYLKGYVGSDYTGDSWKSHSTNADHQYEALMKNIPMEEFSPVNQISQLIEKSGLLTASSYYRNYYMDVEYNEANKKYLYVPYIPDFDGMDNITFKQDLYAAPVKKRNNYTIKYISVNPDFTRYADKMKEYVKPAKFSEYAERYRDFVYETYTQLPEEGLERLKKDFTAESRELTEADIRRKIEYVRKYLDENTTYTLTPGKLPKGKDYVEYFLYENKQGYCAHYATAATLMLRAMGVPARYIEGYAVGASDVIRNTVNSSMDTTDSKPNNNTNVKVKVSVKDYNAHAWIEVYIDKYGWMPFDPTPGSNMGYDSWDQTAADNAEVTPTKAPPTPTPKITSLDKEEIKPDTPEPTSTVPGNTSKQREQADTLFLLIFILLLIAAIIVSITVYSVRSRKMYNARSYNQKAIHFFAKIEKLLAACKELGNKENLEDNEEYVQAHCLLFDQKEFAFCMEIIRKARFGRGSITSEELDRVERLCHKLSLKVYDGLPFHTKIYLKICHAV